MQLVYTDTDNVNTSDIIKNLHNIIDLFDFNNLSKSHE